MRSSQKYEIKKFVFTHNVLCERRRKRERNDLFILLTDKKNINIFLCKQSYLIKHGCEQVKATAAATK
jgi:hypothetical protein